MTPVFLARVCTQRNSNLLQLLKFPTTVRFQPMSKLRECQKIKWNTLIIIDTRLIILILMILMIFIEIELCSWPRKSADNLALLVSDTATAPWNGPVRVIQPFPPTLSSSILLKFNKEAASDKIKEKLPPDYFTTEISQISHWNSSLWIKKKDLKIINRIRLSSEFIEWIIFRWGFLFVLFLLSTTLSCC